jgi:hypothetical protein
MSEQNRRAVEVEPTPGDAAPPRKPGPSKASWHTSGDDRALGVEADERQTRRQAPDGAGPGEGGEDDSIG